MRPAVLVAFRAPVARISMRMVDMYQALRHTSGPEVGAGFCLIVVHIILSKLLTPRLTFAMRHALPH
jgi:hypothetical protein